MRLTLFSTTDCHHPKLVHAMGQYTLLDNENVLHAVQRYLAAQNLGSITPQLLYCHVNEVILPTLNMTGKNTTITEHTAISWLRKLGYTCKNVKKGVYHDGVP